MLFPKRQNVLAQYTGTAAVGNSISFSITRDFFLSSLYLVVPVTIASATAATPTSMGLWNIVKRLQLSVADGSSNRNQTDVSGAAAIRRAARICSGLDLNTILASGQSLKNLAAVAAADVNATYYVTVPLFFKHPQLSDPIGSALMLPLPRYNSNPTLTVQFGAIADCFSTLTNGTVTIGSPYLIVNKRQVDNISFPVLETELVEISTAYPSTGSNQLQNLQVPGSYTTLDLFCQTTAGVAQDISGGPGNPWTLQYLGNTLRQFNLQDLQIEEQYSQGNAMDLYNAAGASPTLAGGILIPGFYHLDFLHDEVGMEVGELGSVLNTNLLAGSGSQLQLIQTIGTAGSVSYCWERIFGDLSAYKFNFATAAG